MRNWRNWIFPTHNNNYRAHLLNNFSLASLVIFLFLANLFFGGVGITKAYAQVDENTLIDLHNQERSKVGLSPLSYNPLLAASAKAKGEAMLKTDCWSHYCPNGKSPWEFFREANYVYSHAGENLAEGFDDNQAVMRAWMNSKTHRENILKSQFSEVGIAMVYGSYQGLRNNILIVVHFGRPKASSTSSFTPATTPTPGSPTITFPRDNEFINNKRPTIEGEHPKDVEITINNRGSGRIIPNGGAYTYEPDSELQEGENEIKTFDYQDRNVPPAEVKTIVDTTAPMFFAEQLLPVSKNALPNNQGEVVKLEYRSPEGLDKVALVVGEENVEFSSVTDNIFEVEVNVSRLGIVRGLNIVDLAGNASFFEVSPQKRDEIIGKIDSLPLSTLQSGERTPLEQINSQIYQAFSIFSLTPIQALSGFIVLGLIILLVIDLQTMKRYEEELGLHKKTRAHLHLPTLIILLLVILIGNLKGSV